MTDRIDKIVELVGISPDSVTDAIRTAITRSSATIRNIRWFEVVPVRGDVHGRDGGALPGHAQSRLHPRRRLRRLVGARDVTNPT